VLDPQRLQAILAKARSAPCISTLGLRLIEADEGRCKLAAPHNPQFDGLLPGFHGGALAYLADCAAWFAIATRTGPDEPLITTDLQIRFLNPCQTDVTISAKLIKLGRTLCPVALDFHDAQGEHVATG
jgi:uncharacterized protein (TIGR00369 family)